jgi:hypothetical protein
LLFNFLQHICFEILLATKIALLARNVVHNEQPVVVPIKILHSLFLKILVSAKIALLHAILARMGS